MNSEEVFSKSEVTQKCSDLLDIVIQIVSLAPDKEAALIAIREVSEALKTE